MSEMQVTQITIPTLLEKLEKREWLMPKFQREFVWEIPAIQGLVCSVIDSHPIGMATIWEQSDESSLELERISIPDWDSNSCSTQPRYFGAEGDNPNKIYAVLDGRQRSTALAMAFGGFSPTNGNYKYAGRYFLDVTASDEYERVIYKKNSDLKKQNLTTDAACISKGLFPLVSYQDYDNLMYQWMAYLQALKDPSYYENGDLPDSEELERRDQILKKAHRGITETKLAVYIVPENYELGEICDIFETLNTTGTKVSTVDLIHSWLYSDTVGKGSAPIKLREWLQVLGEKDGAIGWSVPDRRPELVAQMVTACHVALEKKYPPRQTKGKSTKTNAIKSVKSPDLLATPAAHWDEIIRNEEAMADFIGDFQITVANGYFSYDACPYPISSAIYVALRWHRKFDDELKHPWEILELNSLYKAFFWRNALSGRYDQGFLTQLGSDIVELKKWLNLRLDHNSASSWATDIQIKLDGYMKDPVPTREQLIDLLTNGRPTGALQSALFLTMTPRVKKDFVSSADLSFPSGQPAQIHHIYPQAWCANYKVGEYATLFDKDKAGRDWVNSVSNLMPLARTTNNEWKAQHPTMFLKGKNLNYENINDCLSPAFIDAQGFDFLMSELGGVKGFWEHRAGLIADHLLSLVKIKV